MRDRISLTGFDVTCVIGVHEHERHHVQPLRIDLELDLDLRPAGHSGQLSQTCDYSRVTHAIGALLRFRRYQLLETAAQELAAMLLGLHPMVQQLTLTLHKPHALPQFRAGASVRVTRERDDFPSTREDTRFGHVDILLETAEAGLYLLQIAPGCAIPAHHHQVMRELEWVRQGELWWNGKRLPHDCPVMWVHGQVHGYENRGNAHGTVFCCDAPAFIPDDEIEVEGGGACTSS